MVVRTLDHADGVDLYVAEVAYRGVHARCASAERRVAGKTLSMQCETPKSGPVGLPFYFDSRHHPQLYVAQVI